MDDGFGFGVSPRPGGKSELSAAQVAKLLLGYSYSLQSEARLQEGIGRVLQKAGIPFQREVWLSEKDRIDFLIESGVGIEVKIQGSVSALTRQAHRYAQHPRIRSLVIACTRHSLARLPESFNDKPICCALLVGSML